MCFILTNKWYTVKANNPKLCPDLKYIYLNIYLFDNVFNILTKIKG